MCKEGTGPSYYVPWDCLLVELPQQCNVVDGIISTRDSKDDSHTLASCLQSNSGTRNKSPKCERGRMGLVKALLAIAQEAMGYRK